MALVSDGEKKYFDDQLLRCIKERKNNEVKEILKNEKPGDLIDSSQSTLLHYAAKYGATNLINYFVSVGCNVNAQDELGKSPLIFALEENHELTVNALLDVNANLYTIDSQGRSALQLAFDAGTVRSLKIVEMCLHRVAKQHKFNSEEIAKKLIEANCPLYFAMYLKNVAVSKILIDHGSSVNSRDRATGETALHVAAKLKYVENVRLLVEHGADVNAKDYVGNVPFCSSLTLKPTLANADEDFEIFKILLDRGMLLTSVNYKGEMQAYRLSLCDEKLIELIFDYDVDFTARDAEDNTIVHYLAMRKSVDYKKLERKNFNANLRNKTGKTVLQLAFEYDNVKLINFLLDNGAKIDYPNDILAGYFTSTARIITYRLPKFVESFVRYEEGIQFILKHREKIFNNALKMKFNIMTKYALALSAMIDATGTSVGENILKVINDDESFTKKYDTYKTELEEMKKEVLYESVTLFKLLTDSENKIVLYMRNPTLVASFAAIEDKLRSKYSLYYIDVLKQRVKKAIRIAELKAAAEIILCKIIGINADAGYVIVDNLFRYLDEKDLKNLINVQC